jgi:hypothetical protein
MISLANQYGSLFFKVANNWGIILHPDDLDIDDFERLVNMRLVENEVRVYIKFEAEWRDKDDYMGATVKDIYLTIIDASMIAPGADMERVLCI